MRPPRPGPRSALFSVAAVTVTAGSLLVAPQPAGADPKPPVREGSALSPGAAQAPASVTRRALTAPVADLADSAGTGRGYPREQVLSPDQENPADKSLKLGLTPYHAIRTSMGWLEPVRR